MEEKHMLEQIGSGHVFYPEKELIHRHDMRHVMARLEKGKGYVVVGPYTGDVQPEPEEKTFQEMTKQELVDYAMKVHNHQIELPMRNADIIDVLMGLEEEKNEL